MGKLNASVGENILFHFLRDENASALSGVFISFPFSINQLVVEHFHLNPLHSWTLRKRQEAAIISFVNKGTLNATLLSIYHRIDSE